MAPCTKPDGQPAEEVARHQVEGAGAADDESRQGAVLPLLHEILGRDHHEHQHEEQDVGRPHVLRGPRQAPVVGGQAPQGLGAQAHARRLPGVHEGRFVETGGPVARDLLPRCGHQAQCGAGGGQADQRLVDERARGLAAQPVAVDGQPQVDGRAAGQCRAEAGRDLQHGAGLAVVDQGTGAGIADGGVGESRPRSVRARAPGPAAWRPRRRRPGPRR
jgi:hypothetical protein